MTTVKLRSIRVPKYFLNEIYLIFFALFYRTLRRIVFEFALKANWMLANRLNFCATLPTLYVIAFYIGKAITRKLTTHIHTTWTIYYSETGAPTIIMSSSFWRSPTCLNLRWCCCCCWYSAFASPSPSQFYQHRNFYRLMPFLRSQVTYLSSLLKRWIYEHKLTIREYLQKKTHNNSNAAPAASAFKKTPKTTRKVYFFNEIIFTCFRAVCIMYHSVCLFDNTTKNKINI